jgi:hypothetical protein
VPIVPVSLKNGEAPSPRTIELRTPKLTRGVLCDVLVDERMQLCIVDRVYDDGAVCVRLLPDAPIEEGVPAKRR